MNDTVLEIVGLHKSFGALAVTRNINFRLEIGARHALIGPNGAGKTTLVNLITGALAPSSGSIRLEGRDITRYSPQRRVSLGLARTFQINSLFPSMTVVENIALAVVANMHIDAKLWGALNRRKQVLIELERLLDVFNLSGSACQLISNLAYGQRRLVELALALALKPKVLILDEPAAGLPKEDSGKLSELLRRLPADLAVIVIEHDMQIVFGFADRITVLAEGSVLTQGTPSEIRADAKVREVYLGQARND